MKDFPADAIAQFQAERLERIEDYNQDDEWNDLSKRWQEMAFEKKYVYNFEWMDRPIIQMPSDILAVQDAIWKCKPDLIIETGIAHGGSLALSASILALLDIADAASTGDVLDPKAPRRKVLGIDIDIREHNLREIERHPMFSWMELIEGSSTAQDVIDAVAARVEKFDRIMVILDSNHTHEHVLAELEAYAPFVSMGSYCIVYDTVIEFLPATMYPDRPWHPGANPKTAIDAFLSSLEGGERVDSSGTTLTFEVDSAIDSKSAVSSAPGGFLLRTNARQR